MPNMPTIAESGIPGYEANCWWGMVVPAGTPRDIIGRLNDEVNNALHKESVKGKLSGLGASAIGGPPEQFSEFIHAEIKKWTEVMKKAGIADL